MPTFLINYFFGASRNVISATKLSKNTFIGLNPDIVFLFFRLENSKRLELAKHVAANSEVMLSRH
jgi:hypothetical protein